MRRPFKRVHGGFLTISLLGASTILLAAAGETVWHANSAATSEGQWAAPTVGVEAAAAAGSAGSAEAESEMLTTPIFKPFVLVRIPLPSGYSSGEVMDVNESGHAVGWMHHDNQNRDHGFYFDPAAGVTILDIDTQQHDSATAYAISDEATLEIAGAVMWKGQPNYLRACTWDRPSGDLEVPFAGGVVSEAFATATVSSTQTLAGRYEVSSQPRSVVYNGSLAYPASGIEGEARDVNSSGKVVGWHTVSSVSHAYAWVPRTTTDIHPNPYDASGAFAINDSGYIGGWVDDEGDILPALWTPLTPGVYTVEPFDDAGADATVTAINGEGEMAIMRTDATPGVAIWSKRASVNHADLLDNVTLMRGGSDLIYSAHAINDAGWIGGSYLAGGTGDPLPCLVIPYDINNNGESDYREILDGVEDDLNENWLIDWAEDMRVGLHAPGPADRPEGGLDPVQVVRTRINIKPREGVGPEGIVDDIYIDEVVNPAVDCEPCERFTEYVDGWGTGAVRPSPATDEQSEIIARVHSLMGEDDEDWGDHEGLPANGTVRAEALEDIHSFAYRFAHCIDWLQWGNESYGGAAGYGFRYTDVPSCSWDPEQGPSPYRLFSSLPSDDCRETALDLILEWQVEQMWAALEGSALAGRPLRMTSSGVAMISVMNGYDCENNPVGCNVVSRVSETCNANQMYIAQHMHYEVVSHVQQTIDKLTGTGNFTSPPWDVPNWRVCTELGAAADFGHGWWSTPTPYWFNQYKDYFFENRDAPDFFWEEFIERWAGIGELNGQFTDGIELDSVLNSLATGGFVTACHSALQFDSGTEAAPSRHQVEGLRATQLIDPENMTKRQYLFTPASDWYLDQYAAPAHKIQSFNPHPNSCDPSHTCPGCQ